MPLRGALKRAPDKRVLKRIPTYFPFIGARLRGRDKHV